MSTFEEIHQQGATRFGLTWLRVNGEVARIAREHGVVAWEEPARTALSAIAFAWCEEISSHQAPSG